MKKYIVLILIAILVTIFMIIPTNPSFKIVANKFINN